MAVEHVMSDAAPMVEVTGLHHSFGSGPRSVPVIDGVDFSHREGEFFVIVGPSGCGKTTLLRLVAGLLSPDGGEIRHRGRAVDGPPPWASIVFQEYNRSLLPWLSVRRNVAFGISRVDRSERERRVGEALDAVGLTDAADRYPWQLSGGMQQRTALARALAAGPELLLLDEPFASVDAQTRIELEELVMELWQQLGFSAVLVTHDIDEAVLMADRVMVLSHSPARVLAEVEVDLPRPRDHLGTKEHPRFLALRHEVFARVRDSARRVPEAGTRDVGLEATRRGRQR